MFVVACSGFPIAVSRYLQEFMAVEVADTELGIPGTGTLRRWLRESPDGFVFTVLAPQEIGASGFRAGGETDQALKSILSFCKKLEARALVFRVPEDVAHNRSVAARAKKLLGNLPAGAPPAVLDAPHWKTSQVDKICEASGAVAARDPLELPEAPDGSMAYLTLPGPAGHRSRYDDEAIEQIADVCRRSKAEDTFCVFRNIDMEANAKSLFELLGEGGPPDET
ncbi:MAG TPA: DUF72 domain-containing protein [Sandaracinaceae bacterium LLY-WYZ-13_1]|nr:DUF72 domain-containing protein [Sandaracinaceae bacterium LLY-WYZ-13_1]